MKENKSTGSPVTPHRDELVSSSEARELALRHAMMVVQCETEADDLFSFCAADLAALIEDALAQQSAAQQSEAAPMSPAAHPEPKVPLGGEDAKDAARYRWLKQASKAEYLWARGAFALDDAAIDAAIAKDTTNEGATRRTNPEGDSP